MVGRKQNRGRGQATRRRTLPRALVLGVIAVAGAYVLVSGAFLYLVPPENVTSDRTFVAQAGAVLFGRAGGICSRRRSGLRRRKHGSDDHVCPRASITRWRKMDSSCRAVAQSSSAYLALLRCDHDPGIDDARCWSCWAPSNKSSPIPICGGVVPRADRLPHCSCFARGTGSAATVGTPGYPVTPLVFLVLVAVCWCWSRCTRRGRRCLGFVVVSAGLPVYAFSGAD